MAWSDEAFLYRSVTVFARSRGSPGKNRRPFCPFVMSSDKAPRRPATIGVPRASDSTIVFGKPSYLAEGQTKKRASRRSSSMTESEGETEEFDARFSVGRGVDLVRHGA